MADAVVCLRLVVLVGVLVTKLLLLLLGSVVGRCSSALDTVWKVDSLIDSVVVSRRVTGLLLLENFVGGFAVVVVLVADFVVSRRLGGGGGGLDLSTLPGTSLLSTNGFGELSTSMALSWGEATSGSGWCWSSLQQLPK